MSYHNIRITGIPAPLATDYDRQVNFTDFEILNPGEPPRGVDLDAEFNAIEQALDETQDRLRLLQRDDGAVANESIGLDQLKTEAKIGVNTPADWQPFTQYQVNDSVIVNEGAWYIATTSHVSSDDFDADELAGYWEELIDLTPYTVEAKNWATYPEDQLVPEGNGTTEYSSWHHRLKAEDAHQAGVLAQTAAEQAQSLAEQAQFDAEQAEAGAVTARTGAETARTGAETAQTAAETAETGAQTAETSAENLLANFQDRYWGAYASDPATSPGTGAFPQVGNLYWNTTTDRLRVHDGISWADVDLSGAVLYTALTGSAVVPSGTEAQRDASPQAGYLRFNSDTGLFEGYTGASWASVGAGATGSSGDQVFVENDQTVSADYTIPGDKNAMSTGPVTVADGVTVTVSDGARWAII